MSALVGATSCGSDQGPDPATGVNLRIDAMYVVQSVQTREGDVPLVAGRDGELRVFATASAANMVTPPVRVRIYKAGVLQQTMTLPAGGASVPTSVDQSTLTKSWNLKIPGALIQPGLQILADVDPDNEVAESNEQDNSFPASGSPRSLQVAALQTFKIRFVSIVQAENGLAGNVNASNIESYLTFTRKIHPVSTIDADLRAPYTVNGLGFDPEGNTWQTAVAELDAVRVAEGSDRFYYGVVNTAYNGGGVVGIAAGIPAGAALGWDRFPDAPITVAHEIGHDWGRFHSPCGGAGGADPSYPYPLGLIGVHGFDLETGEVKLPNANTDIMGYCNVKFWISDYTYTGIFNYRLSHPAAAVRPKVPSLVLWGSVEKGVPKLEPAFEAVTMPTVSSPGPYRVEGLDSSGAAVFSQTFAAAQMPDAPGDIRHFALAVPLSADQVARIATLRLVAGGRESRISSRPGSPNRLAVVRDASTGEILSLVRGDVPKSLLRRNVRIQYSDGIHTPSRLPSP